MSGPRTNNPMKALAALGIDNEQIMERVVGGIVDGYLEDGALQNALDERIRTAVDDAVDKLAAQVAIPEIEDYIAKIPMEKTNTWGEPTGERDTFREYLVKRMEQWMGETVDYNGDTKDRDRMGWRGTGRASRSWSRSTCTSRSSGPSRMAWPPSMAAWPRRSPRP